MSGILKSATKVFKKVVKSKVFKIAAIAAAIYFTGGLALAAAGSEFAAGLPMISSLGESLGILGAAGDAAGAIGTAAEVGESVSGAAQALGGAAEVGESVSGAAQGIANSGMQESVFTGPQTAIAKAPVTTPFTPPTSAGTAAANAAGAGATPTDSSFSKWIASDGAKNILAKGIATGGGAALSAISQSANVKAYTEERQKDRDIRANNSRTIDLTNTFRPAYGNISTNPSKPGIVNAYGLGG